MKRTVVALAAVVMSLGAMAVTPEGEGKASINTSDSKLEWVGEKVTGKHWGTVNIKSGSLMVNGDKITGGEVVIDFTSISVDDLQGEYKGKLEGHLKSDDFFSAEKNPNGTFKIKKVAEKAGKNGNTHVITGDMTIKGITKEISFPARVTMNDGEIKAFASFTLDRTLWDIKYGSGSFFDDLGDKTIYDDFQVKFSLVANM